MLRPFSHFFTHWWNLLTLPSWYSEAVKKSWLFVLSLAVAITFLLTLIKLPQLYVRVFPVWRLRLEETLAAAATNFPASLSLTWNGSNLELTPSEPTVIPFPEWWKNNDLPPDVTPPAHLALIDPANNSPLQKESWVVLTPETLKANNWMGNQSEIAWAEVLEGVPPYTLTASSFSLLIPQILQTYDNVMKYSPLFLAPLLTFTSLLGLIFGVVWESFFFYILLKISTIKMNYQSLLKLTVFIFLAAKTIEAATSWLYPSLDSFWVTLTLWVYFFVILHTQRRQLETQN